MDKETLSNYGWIIIVALVGAIMIAMSTPLGNYIFVNIKNDTIKEIEDVSIGEDNDVDVVGVETAKKINYVLNGGEFVGGYPTTFAPRAGITLPTNVKKENYDFGGWYIDAECVVKRVQSIDTNAHHDQTFYAKWVPKQFVITYNLNGGSFTQPDNVEYHYSYKIKPNLPTATTYGGIQKIGYSFVGWYDANTDRLFRYNTNMATNLSLYAKWEKE